MTLSQLLEDQCVSANLHLTLIAAWNIDDSAKIESQRVQKVAIVPILRYSAPPISEALLCCHTYLAQILENYACSSGHILGC